VIDKDRANKHQPKKITGHPVLTHVEKPIFAAAVAGAVIAAFGLYKGFLTL
jgi:arginine:ornithine antiporter/lysine permease